MLGKAAGLGRKKRGFSSVGVETFGFLSVDGSSDVIGMMCLELGVQFYVKRDDFIRNFFLNASRFPVNVDHKNSSSFENNFPRPGSWSLCQVLPHPILPPALSSSAERLEFYEEITPLVVAAEYGTCEVIKAPEQRERGLGKGWLDC